MSKYIPVNKRLAALEADFKNYIDSQVNRKCGVYACNYCKHGTDDWSTLSCDNLNCDGVNCWEWREHD